MHLCWSAGAGGRVELAGSAQLPALCARAHRRHLQGRMAHWCQVRVQRRVGRCVEGCCDASRPAVPLKSRYILQSLRFELRFESEPVKECVN